MKTNNNYIIALFILGMFFTFGEASGTPSAGVDTTQLAAILPDWQDLRAFVKTSPAGEAGQIEIFENGRWAYHLTPAAVMPDDIESDVDMSQRYASRGKEYLKPWRGHYSSLRRNLFSDNGIYRIQLTVWVCDSGQTAQYALEEYHESSEAVFHAGTFTSAGQIGDACWVCSEYPPDKSLIFLAGKMLVLINGGPSHSATNQGIDLGFPASALEAIAYQSLLNASQQPELTGVSIQQTNVAINGRVLPKNALKVAGRVYVPVQEFAKAMGLTSHWNSKTGTLTLNGPKQKAIALTAGSTAASVGGVKASALTVPVLKDGGQPVMTLDDLLKLTGGRITSHAGDTVQVKG